MCVDSYIYIYITRVMIFLFFFFVGLVCHFLYTYYYACLFDILYFCYQKAGLSAGGRCNGTRNLIIWGYSRSVRGILIATIRRPMRRTGKLASYDVTVPVLINIYLVSCELNLVL